MIIEREIDNKQYRIELTADEIRQAHEEFVFPTYIESVDSLNLGRHWYHCFHRYDIKTITDLVKAINSGDICGYRSIGPANIKKACTALDERNIAYDLTNVRRRLY